ncbi:ABC transporter ATP-binding protein [Acidipropionibacterium virtanenii]|uniref:Ferric enterobactin transport ATP-binding protein FepC n=1 Tax=Acidipropionibacterium virtanenii TaxID=2057246 RepID=A0A344URM2_9ACTN|nr:ABC transporter ATP-binding protein [Acidipropionibacterium virtanenii]AXE37920.1 Ferric enterobactin transport ATP-binding protein FepC [Acidipropionibacterium virtanenii]
MTDHTFSAQGVAVGYGDRSVIEALDLTVPDHGIGAIIGPNGCGKSTLLRTLSRLLRPSAGSVLLDGQAISSLPTRKVARLLGLLPQSPTCPEGIAVADLVSRGRAPHRGAFARWSAADDRAVADALDQTGTAELAHRPVDELSGGQRQRVWIAMALAQQTDLLLLDEPTTYLDLTFQIDVLELLGRLNRDRGTTVVMVLHDINMAARYCDWLVAMRDGSVRSQGAPCEVVTEPVLREVFDLETRILTDPVNGSPVVVPLGRAENTVRTAGTADADHDVRSEDPSRAEEAA